MLEIILALSILFLLSLGGVALLFFLLTVLGVAEVYGERDVVLRRIGDFARSLILRFRQTSNVVGNRVLRNVRFPSFYWVPRQFTRVAHEERYLLRSLRTQIEWDPQRNSMLFATKEQLERLLIRAFQEFIPVREFTAALRIAEGMQYAKNANLTLCGKAADVARNVRAATASTSERKDVAHRILSLWREKLVHVLRVPKLYSRQEVNQFLETAKKDNLKELLLQIEGSLNFLEKDLRFKNYVVSCIKERAMKVDNEELTRRAEVVLEKIDELNELDEMNDFCKQISEESVGLGESIPVQTEVYGFNMDMRNYPEP